MQTTRTLALAAVLAGIVSYGVSAFLSPRPELRDDGVESKMLAELSTAVGEMRDRQEQLADALEELAARDVAGAGLAAIPRTPIGDIDAAVRRYFESNPDLATDEVAPVADDAEVAEPDLIAGLDPEHAELDVLLARLFDDDLDQLTRENLWQRVRDAGRIDEVIAGLEAAAEARPDDPGAQLDVGVAYIQKIQELGNGPLAGVFAGKADAAFDRALMVDAEHWDARFHKAVALSFWPPVFGKQNEAIQHFEILASQQASATPQPSHAQTHLLLGNMHQQVGNTEKAIAAWKLGLELFPDNEALRQQLELVGH